MSANLCLVAAKVSIERFVELLGIHLGEKSGEELFDEDWVTNFADNGFTILRSNDEGWAFRNYELLAEVSTHDEVYSSQISEQHSTSDVVCFRGGREGWRVFHGLNRECKMVTELTGEAIPEFQKAIKTASEESISDDDLFEVSIRIFAERTGYQYDYLVSPERSSGFWSVTLAGK